MSQTEYTLSVLPLYTSNGPVTEQFPKGSILVGVCTEGNTPAVVYWAPVDEVGAVPVDLYLATQGYCLRPVYGEVLNPQRFRYLGGAVIDNGTQTVHIFELQPERSYPFDATV